jgi:opacity protein-like surface antigen
MLGVDLGVSAMNESGPFGFGNGVGSVTSPGPAWGARVGVEFFPWLALEGRYLGMYNSIQASVSPGGSAGFLTTGAEAVARLTAPLPYVHPYVFAGAGYYDIAFVGSSGSELHSSSQCGVPMGLGLDVPLTWHLSIGAEATYRFQIHESFSAVTTNGIDGGDISTFNAVLRARL